MDLPCTALTWSFDGPLRSRAPGNSSLWLKVPASHPLQFLALEGLLENRQNPDDPASRDIHFPQLSALLLRLLTMAGLDVAQLKYLPVDACILTLHKINNMVNCMRAAGLDFAGITLRKDLVKIVLSSSVVSEEDFKLHVADT